MQRRKISHFILLGFCLSNELVTQCYMCSFKVWLSEISVDHRHVNCVQSTMLQWVLFCEDEHSMQIIGFLCLHWAKCTHSIMVSGAWCDLWFNFNQGKVKHISVGYYYILSMCIVIILQWAINPKTRLFFKNEQLEFSRPKTLVRSLQVMVAHMKIYII